MNSVYINLLQILGVLDILFPLLTEPLNSIRHMLTQNTGVPSHRCGCGPILKFWPMGSLTGNYPSGRSYKLRLESRKTGAQVPETV